MALHEPLHLFEEGLIWSDLLVNTYYMDAAQNSLWFVGGLYRSWNALGGLSFESHWCHRCFCAIMDNVWWCRYSIFFEQWCSRNCSVVSLMVAIVRKRFQLHSKRCCNIYFVPFVGLKWLLCTIGILLMVYVKMPLGALLGFCPLCGPYEQAGQGWEN